MLDKIITLPDPFILFCEKYGYVDFIISEFSEFSDKGPLVFYCYPLRPLPVSLKMFVSQWGNYRNLDDSWSSLIHDWGKFLDEWESI